MKSAWSLFKVLFAICLGVILASAVRAGDEFYEEGKEPANQIGALALTLGSPAGINFTFVGGAGPEFGPYLSGMYWDGDEYASRGVQAGIVKLFHKKINRFQGIVLSAGHTYTKDHYEIKKYTFGGIGHIWKWKALYTQVDLMFGSGDFDTTQLGLQIGVNLATVRDRKK